jgi:hypothetical protein
VKMLDKLSYTQEIAHEQDKIKNPYRHRITQNSYSREEAQDLCKYCIAYYNINDLYAYDIRTDRLYKKRL